MDKCVRNEPEDAGSVNGIDNLILPRNGEQMARRMRLEFPGARYYLLNRGRAGAALFRDDTDRATFLQTLGEAWAKTGWRIHAYCLLSDEFHLVLETPHPNLVTGMKWLLGVYTGRFQRRHQVHGPLFRGRYEARLLDPRVPSLLLEACDYVHWRAVDVLSAEVPVVQYPWSSAFAYHAGMSQRPEWLREEIPASTGARAKDTSASRQQFARHLETLRRTTTTEDWSRIRRSWSQAEVDYRRNSLRSGDLGTESPKRNGEGDAETLIADELARLGWTEASLFERKKGDPGKIQIASQLRARTVLTLRAIATRLHMGTAAHLSHLLYWRNKVKKSRRKNRPPL